MANIYSSQWFVTFLDTIDPAMTWVEVAFLMRWLPKPSYHRILDLCCGNGRHARLLAEHGYMVTGVDVNATALAAAERLSADNANIEYRLLDMRELDTVEETFDGIISMWQSFGYFDAATNADILRQISWKLRPHGRLVIDLNNRAYFTQSQETQHYERNGQTIVGTRHLIGNRMLVELDYGRNLPPERFEWQLYTPNELCAVAQPLGLIPKVVCTWCDETRPASRHDARMQIVFERTDAP
ncbi:MAG TPA: class I SAM-dependent methyltransferase [Chloroflexia bacterium]|nr:class I SAM-dependent methyltransferase [Chloroflexia bacterium]